MGMGKTIQSLSILAYLYEFKNTRGPHLIIVPKSTIPNWKREIAKWVPEMRLAHLNPRKGEREEILADFIKP
jgi:SNF2 family DNA or RNA helicase